MAEWGFSDWLRNGALWLGIFAGIGGIVSLTTTGASGRGFIEGAWKGIEVFFIAAAVILLGWGALYFLGMVSNSVNSSM